MDDPLSGELDALRQTCRRQVNEIRELADAVAVFRTGAHALAAENARLRSDIAQLRGRPHRVRKADLSDARLLRAVRPLADT